LISSTGQQFPKDFKNTCRNIFKRLARVFSHVYIHHFDKITEIGAEAHINACFKHFYFFTQEFKLVDEKEFEPVVRKGFGHFFFFSNVAAH